MAFIEIETPDGIVEFPDTMTPEQIEAVLRDKYPPTKTSTETFGRRGATSETLGGRETPSISDIALRIGQAVGRGVANIPGMAVDIATTIKEAAMTQPEGGLLRAPRLGALREVGKGAIEGSTFGLAQFAPPETEEAKAQRELGSLIGFGKGFGTVKGIAGKVVPKAATGLTAGAIAGGAEPLSRGEVERAIEGAVSGIGLVGTLETIPRIPGAVRRVRDFNVEDVNIEALKKYVTAKDKVAPEEVQSIIESTDKTPLPARVGNIDLSKIDNTDAAKQVIIQTAERHKGLIDEARRGTMTLQQTKYLADELGMSLEDLLENKKGAALNAEQLMAGRRLLADSAVEVRNAAEQSLKSGLESDKLLALNSLRRHAQIQAAVSGAIAETGRAMRGLQEGVRGTDAFTEAVNLISKMPKVTDEIMNRLATIDKDRVSVTKFIREVIPAANAPFKRMLLGIQEAWINWGLLSGPVTHIVNAVGNTAFLFMRPLIERPLAKLVSKAGFGVPELTGSSIADLRGIVHGSREGIRRAWFALKNEFPEDLSVGKIELPTIPAIKGPAGRLARLPGTLMLVADEFFKALNYTGELYTRAYGQASLEGFKDAAFNKRVAELITNPPADIKLKASHESEVRTFTDDPGPTINKLIQARADHPVLRFIAPFIRTPWNIARQTLAYSPLPLIDPKLGRNPLGQLYRARGVMRQLRTTPEWKKSQALDLERSKMQPTDPKLLDLRIESTRLKLTALNKLPTESKELLSNNGLNEITKSLVGSAIMIPLVTYFAEGSITGKGPESIAERRALESLGWQPYSVKVGSQYFSYRRIEPLGSVLGLIADGYDLGKGKDGALVDVESFAAFALRALRNNLLDKTFTKSLFDLVNAISDPKRYGENFLERFFSSFVPAISSQVAQANDLKIRKPEGISQAIQARLPGLYGLVKSPRENVPIVRDIWGRPIQAQQTGIEQLVSPFPRSIIKRDPASEEVIRLGIRIESPIDTLTRNKVAIELTDAEYEQYQIRSGSLAHEATLRLVASLSYRSATPQRQKERLLQVISEARGRAKNELIREMRNKGTLQQRRNTVMRNAEVSLEEKIRIANEEVEDITK